MGNYILTIWSIYDSPSDYPGRFVARRFTVDGKTGAPIPHEGPIVRGSLEEIRRAIPPCLARIARDPSDEPQIVESWI